MKPLWCGQEQQGAEYAAAFSAILSQDKGSETSDFWSMASAGKCWINRLLHALSLHRALSLGSAYNRKTT